jgi:predicted AlkP superfamily pyrophosphatase or phosphodiesterase
MLKHSFLTCLLGVALLVFKGDATAATNRHVILITMDGFAAYLLRDPQAPIPTLRRMAREGAVAEGMRVSNPAITWPNHTTLVTGVHPEKHSVLFNGVLVRPGPGLPVRVDGKRDKADLVPVPTVYDLAHKAGLRTAGINWPCTRNSGTLDDDFPDVPDQVAHTTPRLREELDNILSDQQSFQTNSAAGREQIWTAAALHVVKKRKPNFMLWHMLITDTIHHRYGAQSPASYTAVAMVDNQLKQLLEALKEAAIYEQTTLFVTADHGFDKALKLLNPNVLFRKAGLLETGPTPGILKARAQIISEGGIAMVYLTNPETQKEDEAKVKSLMGEAEGIAEILGPERFAGLGMPDPRKNPQMANLILVGKEGYAFGSTAVGEEYVTQVTLAAGNQGHHGFLSTNPKMNAVFVAWGAGIKRGAKLGVIENVDVAPTMARLLGLELRGATGKVLSDLFAE